MRLTPKGRLRSARTAASNAERAASSRSPAGHSHGLIRGADMAYCSSSAKMAQRLQPLILPQGRRDAIATDATYSLSQAHPLADAVLLGCKLAKASSTGRGPG